MYFRTFVVQANQPNFGEVASKLENALNNYKKFGIASDQANFFLENGIPRIPLQKEKVIKHTHNMQTVLNGTIYTTVVLCCEDDL